MPQETALQSSGSGQADRDYVKIAKDYAKAAASPKNKQRFGRWVRLAALRFLADLKRAAATNPPFTFDEWHACDACGFIEELPHVEGKWTKATIELHSSDVFFIVQLFGFRSLEGTRRFSTAVKAVARKNAKSTIAAGIGLYCQTCEDEVGPQVISAATTGSQARIIFNIAKRMVEQTKDLREAKSVEAFVNSIASYENGGSFKPINAKASTQDGLNPSAGLLDEIHAHKNHDLLNVIQSAAGARRNQLWLFTTTEGYETPGPWPELRHFMQQVLLGVIEADHFLGVYYALDDPDPETGDKGDDDFDESAWVKANPLMDVNPILLRELRKEAIEAKGMPGKLAEFRIKRLNRRSSTGGGWINFPKWRLCGEKFDLEALRPHPCWGGLDLASTTDLCSFRLVWHVEGVYYTWGRRWVPKSAVQQRRQRGLVPYQGWVASGYLEEIEGEVIDHDVIELAVLEAKERFNLCKVGHDTWNAAQISKKLTDAGVPMEPFIQGPKSYHPAMQEFERAYMAGNFRHGDDPVLNWCASNIVARRDVNLNMAPDRKRSADKIDDMVAMLMAFGVSLVAPETPPSFQIFFA